MSPAPEIIARYEIGTHSFTVESNEVVLISTRGQVTSTDAQMIQEKLVESQRIYTQFNLIADLSEMTGMDSAARQKFVRVDRPYPLRRIIIVGTSFAMRVLAMGIHRAGRTLRPGEFTYAMHTVDTVEDARQLIRNS